MNSRLFLALALGVPACVSCATVAQNAAEPPFTLEQVGPNVWAAISNHRRQCRWPLRDRDGYTAPCDDPHTDAAAGEICYSYALPCGPRRSECSVRRRGPQVRPSRSEIASSDRPTPPA
jgi:hypothetical protein